MICMSLAGIYCLSTRLHALCGLYTEWPLCYFSNFFTIKWTMGVMIQISVRWPQWTCSAINVNFQGLWAVCWHKSPFQIQSSDVNSQTRTCLAYSINTTACVDHSFFLLILLHSSCFHHITGQYYASVCHHWSINSWLDVSLERPAQISFQYFTGFKMYPLSAKWWYAKLD